jgi:hypothetical protein
MIGTDIASFPYNTPFRPSIKPLKQNMLKEWLADWKGIFAFVRQQGALVSWKPG